MPYRRQLRCCTVCIRVLEPTYLVRWLVAGEILSEFAMTIKTRAKSLESIRVRVHHKC